MRLLNTITALLMTLIIVGCTATVTAQCVGVGMLWSRGMFAPGKVVRFAGVLYGLDPLDLSESTDTPGEKSTEEHSPVESLDKRAQNTPYIAARQSAIRESTDDTRGIVLTLQTRRDRLDESRREFQAYLQQLESENTVTALGDIQTTIESLPPKQAKDLIYSILTDSQLGPGDDPLSDVVAIVKSMPAEKIKKIYGECKTNEERDMLHQILVRVGNLDKGLGEEKKAPP